MGGGDWDRCRYFLIRGLAVDYDRDLSVLAVATSKGRSKFSYTSCTMSFKHTAA